MKELNDTELKLVVGGLNFSASLLNGIIKGANFIYGLGQSIGTAIRRIKTRRLC